MSYRILLAAKRLAADKPLILRTLRELNAIEQRKDSADGGFKRNSK